MEKAATAATESAPEALTTPLQNYVSSETYKSNQNLPEENIPEWVTLAKGQINDTLAIKVTTWWTELVNYASSSKKTETRASQGSVYFELRSFIRSVVNEINGAVARLLTVCDQKKRDKASKLRIQFRP